MQITAELEDSPRGVYTGAIGWLAPPGQPERLRFNVAIRTVEIHAASGAARFGTGSGITHDSVAAAEYEECLAKALVLTERRPSFQLLESILLRDREFVWMRPHLDRLAASADYFDFRFDQNAALKALDAVRDDGDDPAKVRMTLSRTGEIGVSVHPLGDTGPVRVTIDDVPVDPRDPFLFHKTTLRDCYAAAAGRHPEADDVLLVNDRGEITEATSSNLLARIDGQWVTPSLACGLLPGVHRAMLLERGEVHERVLTPADLARSEELALINSVRLRREARLV
jgi:para-aminobenzoate synthetase/4-amino-4-deoxychorismate lyase